MSDNIRQITERFGLSSILIAACGLVAGAFIIAFGFDFEIGKTLEVILTGILIAGVMGLLASLAYLVGILLDAIESSRD